jgi:hypothetical protein
MSNTVVHYGFLRVHRHFQDPHYSFCNYYYNLPSELQTPTFMQHLYTEWYEIRTEHILIKQKYTVLLRMSSDASSSTYTNKQNKQTPWPLVRELTIPT